MTTMSSSSSSSIKSCSFQNIKHNVTGFLRNFAFNSWVISRNFVAMKLFAVASLDGLLVNKETYWIALKEHFLKSSPHLSETPNYGESPFLSISLGCLTRFCSQRWQSCSSSMCTFLKFCQRSICLGREVDPSNWPPPSLWGLQFWCLHVWAPTKDQTFKNECSATSTVLKIDYSVQFDIFI